MFGLWCVQVLPVRELEGVAKLDLVLILFRRQMKEILERQLFNKGIDCNSNAS